MKTKFGSGSTIINLLMSVVISLMVNFYYLVSIILSNSSTASARQMSRAYRESDIFLGLEVVFYFLLAFILLTAFTIDLDEKRIRKGSFWKRLFICTLITFGLYFCAPVWRHGEILITAILPNRMFLPMTILKCSFSLVVAALYGKIYEVLYQKQGIQVENQRLKTENLQSRYDVLVTQINPHFFFNTLNSLSMLVREEDKEGALTYIDRLSETFRYIIQKGSSNMTTLGEELLFLDAYKYVFEVRYAGKLFIDVNVDPALEERTLPSLSLQPLVENAVKHNTITSSNPLHIVISANKDYLSVSNRIAPKIDKEEGTGIGLKNLSSRYVLLTGKDIVIENDGTTFSVKLPLSARRVGTPLK